MSACNDCWDEAFKRAQIGGGHQAEHYEAILLLPPVERPWCAFAQRIVRKSDREPDPWCRREDCRHRHWRSGSMPTHRRGADCPTEEQP